MPEYTTQFWIISAIVVLGLMLGYLTTKGTKSQWIRIIDIIVIGPLMIYLGWFVLVHRQDINRARFIDICAAVVIFFGATTITYNLRNYLYLSKKGHNT